MVKQTVVLMNKANKIGYGTSVAGANVSVDYNKQEAGGSGKSIAADYAPMDGVNGICCNV
jgi:hypothetical protein